MIAHRLPKTPLTIVEVFDAYDGPRLLSAHDDAGMLFLALWVDDVEDESIWLYLPLSSSRMAELERGEVDLRSAFLTSETNVVFRVRESARDGTRMSEAIPAAAVPHEELPLPVSICTMDKEARPRTVAVLKAIGYLCGLRQLMIVGRASAHFFGGRPSLVTHRDVNSKTSIQICANLRNSNRDFGRNITSTRQVDEWQDDAWGNRLVPPARNVLDELLKMPTISSNIRRLKKSRVQLMDKQNTSGRVLA
jgi:response regulator RpfG family c-di-GMP phosphodiesterase